MAFNLTTVTGSLGDSVTQIATGVLKFELMGIGIASGGQIVSAPLPVTATAAVGGAWTIQLWANEDGLAPTYYKVSRKYLLGTQEEWQFIGNIVVPVGASTTFDACYVSAAIPLTGPSVILSEADYTALANSTLKTTDRQSGPRDSTAGKLLEVGSFGIGTVLAANEIASFDDITLQTGFYSTTAATANPHSGFASSIGELFVHRLSATAFVECWSNNTQNANGGIWKRSYQGGAFGPWVYMFHSGNIFDAIGALSSGRPTGGLMP
uniref:hypothetical protein n=1 Tax=Mangrovicoccus sp. HB161399 TaxID=2720392 RepID=UPI001555D064